MISLRNRIQPYAWGSRTAIAALQGRPVPSSGPEAELWLGAHPAAPSVALAAAGEMPLTDLIAGDPQGVLGPDVVSRFGSRLPYLLKFLAVAAPLSLQAHPDAAQAAAGYAAECAAESAAGVLTEPGRPARARSYPDPYHKPELLVALEDFDALCGFRDPDETAQVLASFGVPELESVIAALATGKPAARLRSAVELLVGLGEAERLALVTAVTSAGAALAEGDPERSPAHGLAAGLGGRYPGDIGVVLALLLNQVRLRPGEAVFMPAGNLHVYLRGTGIEIMAASDNVLRGGLTTKHVDAAELMRILRYEVLAEPVLRPVPLGPALAGWRTPATDFALYRACSSAGAEAVALPASGPRILFCVAGIARVRCGDAGAPLRGGEAVFVAASEPGVEVSGDAVVFQAAPDSGIMPAPRL